MGLDRKFRENKKSVAGETNSPATLQIGRQI